MRVIYQVVFHPCEIDSKYTVGIVTKTYITNWWDRLWGRWNHTINRDFRTRYGYVWYTWPEFVRFSPNSWTEDFEMYRVLIDQYEEHEEREAYIRASEKLC
jgi:hypothetical protein